MKFIKKAGLTEICEATVNEAKEFCAGLEVAGKKPSYFRMDNVLTVHVNNRRNYMIVLTDWMGGLLTSSNTGQVAVSRANFLRAQIDYHGKPS